MFDPAVSDMSPARADEQGQSLRVDARPVLDGLAPGGHSLGNVPASLRRHVTRRLAAP